MRRGVALRRKLQAVLTIVREALRVAREGVSMEDDDAFKLCVVVTDGQISEDRYAQCDAGIRRATMTYTSAMSGDFYDAGAELYRVDGDPVCTDGLADNRGRDPAVVS